MMTACILGSEPWADEGDTPQWAGNSATADQIVEDDKAAKTWYRSFKKAKQEQPESIAMDHDVAERTRPPLGAPRDNTCSALSLLHARMLAGVQAAQC